MDNIDAITPIADAQPTDVAVEAGVENKSAPKRARRTKAAPKVVEAVKKVNARRVRTEKKPRGRRAATAGAAPKAAAPKIEKETVMNFDSANWMNNFASLNTLPGADKLQNLFAEVGSHGQQAVERSRAVAENLVEMTKANVEALVESGRVAAAGAQTLGQEAVARTREGLEQAATQVKSLSDAQSPTEFFQLQGDFARVQFDRIVADSSRFAESLVKLAGEAMQPISTRAALNAEKLNELSA
ncbi:phasin family protein [Sphingomonas arenae]|uniref:phasin family protein n=1 Tax=Sphingomonas arenae TaxID=2812555 RepID=UPI0019680542|nr:phasin family protein [Sphingomonas arenae]